MVRVPCCEKMGLKKGPWTPEEDQILVSYIQKYGHSNWRALPKLAGLLRCGKSCRLRWINYLRPDIKRGNFTIEEEQTIVKLHQVLGNRWSAIAAKLPGRTDNEVKNYWHTHIKKRVQHKYSSTSSANSDNHCNNITAKLISEQVINLNINGHTPILQQDPVSYKQQQDQLLLGSAANNSTLQPINGFSNNVNQDMDFWYDLFVEAGN